MEPIVFTKIADFLRREHLLRDTRGVTLEQSLGFFLFMLSHNASYGDLQYEFKHNGETIHRHIKAIFKIIPALTYKFIKPTAGISTHWKISTDPRFFPFLRIASELLMGHTFLLPFLKKSKLLIGIERVH
jgi:hypothetical protein